MINLRHSLRGDHNGTNMFSDLNQNRTPNKSSLHTGHAEKKNVLAKALSLAAKVQAAGGKCFVDKAWGG